LRAVRAGAQPLHKQRIALVETRTLDTAGSDLAPARLIRYQFGNHLRSASLELDDQAQIISFEEYTPYGSSTYQAVRNQTETPKRYRYTGKERDEESDLNYHGGRYYAPWLARWLSCDDIQDYKVWLAARPRAGAKTITAETHRQRMRTVRQFFERIIEWDWPDASVRNPVIAGDIVKRPEPLPHLPADGRRRTPDPRPDHPVRLPPRQPDRDLLPVRQRQLTARHRPRPVPLHPARQGEPPLRALAHAHRHTRIPRRQTRPHTRPELRPHRPGRRLLPPT
jgi:RHS repeat-associated protein